MSTLVVILTAAMAVPGNGPEMVSGELRQGLDLRGKWEGTLRSEKGRMYPVIFDDGTYNGEGFPALTFDGGIVRFEVKEGRDGELRVEFCGDLCLGIYRWEANQLVICIRDIEEEPNATPSGETLLILHRVKPGK